MENPFHGIWQDCIIAHYTVAARTQSGLQSANTVMLSAGYNQKQIDNLYITATMHEDDLPKDIEIDRTVAERIMKQHEAECQCETCKPTALVQKKLTKGFAIPKIVKK